MDPAILPGTRLGAQLQQACKSKGIAAGQAPSHDTGRPCAHTRDATLSRTHPRGQEKAPGCAWFRLANQRRGPPTPEQGTGGRGAAIRNERNVAEFTPDRSIPAATRVKQLHYISS